MLTHARQALRPHLPLEAEGYKCTTDDLLNVLLGVAANQGTVVSVCRDLVGTPDAATIRSYFNDELCVEDLSELEQRLNGALAGEITARVRQHACDVALDFQDRPYYGKTPQATGLWMRGRARDGTTRFYRAATAYVMQNNLRVTLVIRLCVVRPNGTVDRLVLVHFPAIVEASRRHYGQAEAEAIRGRDDPDDSAGNG